jgi:chromosome segregation ATPase
MTGEEMERAIEFLLNSHAALDARFGETSRQIAETSRRLDSFAETQAELLRVMRQNFEEQQQTNAELRRANATQSRLWEAQNWLNAEQNRLNAELTQANAEQGRLNAEMLKDREQVWAVIRELATSQARADERLRRTDDNLNRLAETVRLHVAGGDGNSGG